MKKLLLLSAVCFVATSASAINLKPYVEGRLTNTLVKSEQKTRFLKNDIKDNTAFGGSIAVGTSINQFRTEVEAFYNGKAKDRYEYTANQYAANETKAYGFFINGYYDIGTFNGFTPYVGAGIGYSWLKDKITDVSFDRVYNTKDHDWGYNVGCGVAYNVQDNTAITLGYRYEDLGEIKEDWVKTTFKGHKISLGLRYTF